MTPRRRFARTLVRWHCLNCGCTGITGGKDEHNLTLSIRRHHRMKSHGKCRFHNDDVMRAAHSRLEAA